MLSRRTLLQSIAAMFVVPKRKGLDAALVQRFLDEQAPKAKHEVWMDLAPPYSEWYMSRQCDRYDWEIGK